MNNPEQVPNRRALHLRLTLLAGLFAISVATLWGQSQGIDFYTKSLQINNAGMVVLGTWALANISTGATMWNRSSGQRFYFHQMNLFWNSVNLAIAGFALFSNLTADYTTWTTDEMLSRQFKTQRLFLINAGLDVVYMGTAFLLRSLSEKYPNHRDRLTGYGNSVLIQGAFLFVFDLVLFGLQRSHRSHFMEQLTIGPAQDTWGLALSIQL